MSNLDQTQVDGRVSGGAAPVVDTQQTSKMPEGRVVPVYSSRAATLGISAVVIALWLAAVVLLVAQFRSPHPAVLMVLGACLLMIPPAALWLILVVVRPFRMLARRQATRVANLERQLEAHARLAGRLAAVENQAAELLARSSPVGTSQTLGASDQQIMDEQIVDVVDGLGSLAAVQRADLTDVLSEKLAILRVRFAVAGGDVLSALPYLRSFPAVLKHLSLTESRALLKVLRRQGYMSTAVPVIKSIADRFGRPDDVHAAALYASELALYRDEIDLNLELPPLEWPMYPEVVLHLVGKALPETQTGYTLRTQYTVEAQQRLGIKPVVVAHAGASNRAHENTETYEHNGIRYYLLGGPQRGSAPWSEWLRQNVLGLADVVKMVRPAALHVHSDFMNAMIALPVARAYGIPLVNETRGFWEESWLSRTAAAEGWDVGLLEAQHGLPDMYSLRAEREAHLRSESDAVVTLARVMRDHIIAAADRLELQAPSISLAPNAVQAEEFPVLVPDPVLREELGIEPMDIVVGYISSIVEYEGIDTLVRGMYELQATREVKRDLEEQGDPGRSHTPSVSWPEGPVGDTGLSEHASAGQTTDTPTETRSPLGLLHESLVRSSQAWGPISAAAVQQRTTTMALGDVNVAMEQAVSVLAEKLRVVHDSDDEQRLVARARDLLAADSLTPENTVHLIIVGDGAELASLKALVKQLALRNVIFTGRVPHDRVRNYYALIDLFVVPRKSAAVTELVTPLKPFEAMSTGRPCLFSDVGALAEIATDSGAAALFKAGDHHDLAVKVLCLLGQPDRLAEMSRTGSRWVRHARTWDHNAVVYRDLYRSLGLQFPETSLPSALLPPEAQTSETLVQESESL